MTTDDNKVWNEWALDTLIGNLQEMNELLHATYQSMEKLTKEIGEDSQWKGFGKEELDAFLELLQQYHGILSENPSETGYSFTQGIEREITQFLQQSQDLQIPFYS